MSMAFELQNVPDPFVEQAMEQERRVFRVNFLIPNEPAEKAGLKAGDVIVQLNGADLPPIRTFKAGFAAINLTIERAGKSMLITIPKRDPKSEQHHIGVDWSEAVFVTREGQTYERISGEWEHIARYKADIELLPSTFRDGLWIKSSRRMRALFLCADNGSTPYDVLERFNATQTPVILSDEELSGKKGGLDANQNIITVNDLDEPDALGVLLHELRHAPQKSDPTLKKLLPLYGNDIQFRRPSDEPVEQEELFRTLTAIQSAEPERVGKIDLVGLKRITASLFQESAQAAEMLKRTKQERETTFHDFFYDEQEQSHFAALEQFIEQNAGNTLISDHGYTELEEIFRTCGIFLADSPAETFRTFAQLEAFEQCLRHGFYLTEPVSFEYDGRTESSLLGLRLLAGGSSFRAKLAQRQTQEVSDALRKTFDKQRTSLQENRQILAQIKQKILGTEIHPGTTVLEVLQLPTWIIELDAEMGKMEDFRTIHEETGINIPTNSILTDVRRHLSHIGLTDEKVRKFGLSSPLALPSLAS